MRHFDPYPLGYWQIDWRKFGERVRLVREENGFNMRDFAKLTGLSAATICRCEKGETVAADYFFTLLQVIGLPFDIPEEVTKRATD